MPVLLTLCFAIGCLGWGGFVLRRWTAELDPALRFGVAGLAGLGLLGTLTFLLGIVPNGFGFGVYVVAAFVLAGLALLIRDCKSYRFSFPRNGYAIAVLAIAVIALFGLVAALAPSDANDWDTLAYHLAVPKLWLQAGHMFSVPSLHHSNFPDVIDDLYVWGLQAGGESGAKAFSLAYLLFGCVAIFGFARQRYGEKAGWWAAVAFATVPVVAWEAGTGYIDVGHGLFAGLGIAFAAQAIAKEAGSRTNGVVLSGVFLGFAAASKYTGLETIFIVALLLAAYGIGRKQVGDGLKQAALCAVIAGVIACPWYIRNIVWVQNPVYPFLYERLGGANWDQRRADIYRNQQQDFGVGRTKEGRDKLAIGHAVLGLEYQPGRYVDPGETTGRGTPMGAVGVAILAALILWSLSGRQRRFECVVLAACGLTFGMWFFLSQQSRYVTSLAPGAAILLGGAVATLRLGPVLAGLTAVQALYSIWLFQSGRFSDQIQVVLGKVSAEDYQTARIPFYAASVAINREVPKTGKVALYDEVFGYLLDVPYMWANPGHSTIIPYDGMKNGDDFVREMKRLGFTHAYISLSPIVKDRSFAETWVAGMGLQGAPVPMPDDVRKAHYDNWQSKWEILLADAVATGKMHLVTPFRNGMLFSFD